MNQIRKKNKLKDCRKILEFQLRKPRKKEANQYQTGKNHATQKKMKAR